MNAFSVDQSDVERVMNALRSEQVVVIPTDTVYGLAADPRSSVAMQRLFAIKERPEGVPVAVLVGSVRQARNLVVRSEAFDSLADAYWPGALTLVADRRPGVEVFIGSTTTIGVRHPADPFAGEIAARFGPVAATSANVHGQPTIVDPAEALQVFGSTVDVVVDGGQLDGKPSTVVDTTCVPPRILRHGALAIDI